jgi:hypothetical protein
MLIGRVSPAGELKEYPVPEATGAYRSITAGADGNMWFAEAAGIGRITTGGALTSFPLPDGGKPTAVATGADGNVWFASGGELCFVQPDPGGIGRVTASGKRGTRRGGAAGSDGAWMACTWSACGALMKPTFIPHVARAIGWAVTPDFRCPRKDHDHMPQPGDAQRLIEEHITALGEQKAQLERALGHLQGSEGGEGQNGGSGRGAGGKGRQAQNAGGGERAPRGARRGEMIADLKANPGSKAGEIASRVGINPNHAQTILGNLVKQGVATKEGQQYMLVAGKS